MAIGVPTAADLAKSIEYYTFLLDEEPYEEGQIFLGTGREVTGAYWKTEHLYLYVFIGNEFIDGSGVDHLGIQFADDADMEDTRVRVESDRWSKDPIGVVWELFPDVFDE